jgi:hypothetical protein
MSHKSILALVLLAVCWLAFAVGCKPVDKKTPDQPAPSTTDSK